MAGLASRRRRAKEAWEMGEACPWVQRVVIVRPTHDMVPVVALAMESVLKVVTTRSIGNPPASALPGPCARFALVVGLCLVASADGAPTLHRARLRARSMQLQHELHPIRHGRIWAHHSASASSWRTAPPRFVRSRSTPRTCQTARRSGCPRTTRSRCGSGAGGASQSHRAPRPAPAAGRHNGDTASRGAHARAAATAAVMAMLARATARWSARQARKGTPAGRKRGARRRRPHLDTAGARKGRGTCRESASPRPSWR